MFRLRRAHTLQKWLWRRRRPRKEHGSEAFIIPLAKHIKLKFIRHVWSFHTGTILDYCLLVSNDVRFSAGLTFPSWEPFDQVLGHDRPQGSSRRLLLPPEEPAKSPLRQLRADRISRASIGVPILQRYHSICTVMEKAFRAFRAGRQIVP